ncbi:antibiotic biosynthesis monooxygenase family protein [Kitasatospora azatica]|uniref:antibiotic biosynthesis monooxygenase family protein n=1 Tax=Kitasatospora azatica TaxID=58347 RepID=UPI000565AA6A|nr:antibiotic biosynthesis monooxygenase [Kitasatospora azatica]
MSAPLFTVINTFTLKNPAEAESFERQFLDHVQWMRRQPGFQAHQAVRSTERPEVYLNFGWWTSPDHFKQVLASETFQAHAKEFHQLVDVEADPSLTVLRIDGGPAGGQPVVVVERYQVKSTEGAEAFEGAYREYAQAAARLDGFGHSDFAKALTRSGGYTAAASWRDEASARAARELPQYAAVLALAEAQTVSAAPVAGNRGEFAKVPEGV